MGRKNWLLSGSPKGAAASAAIYSLVETCKANKINEYNYLKYLFEALPNIPFLREPQLLEDHLPWNEKIQQICK
ncbi:transposase domain-containing protein [Propionispira raffinosivorans]|uniref:transposase domain-containing protein n=1 Tax=Propionispira raffinosivorans TaxID=86959 RepID=UPI0003A61862